VGEGVAGKEWEVAGGPPAVGVVAGSGGAYDFELLGVGGSMATGPRGGPDGGCGPAAEAVRPAERERHRPGRTGPSMGGAGGGGEEKTARR